MGLIKQIAIAAVLIGLAVAGAVYGLPFLSGEEGGRAGGRPDRGPAPVIAEPVRLDPERTVLEAVGTAEAVRSATLYPATSGEVVAQAISPDKAVEKGDVLVELDHRAEDLAVSLAEVRVKEARQLLDRYEKTSGTGAVPESTVDEARTALETARLELRRARLARDDRRVVAPFAGHLSETDVDVGDRIGPDDAITTLDDRSSLLVRFQVPEAFLDRLAIGETIAVSPGLNRDRTIDGTLIDLGSRIDPATRSVQARARIANPDDRLRPGMSFAVRLELLGDTHALVPEVAVQWGGDGPFLWVVRAGKAARVPLRIVQRREGLTLVDAGLEDGELVVVEGVQRMREGEDVSLATADAAGAAGT